MRLARSMRWSAPHRAGVGQRAALDPFGGQHALAGALPVDLRRVDITVDGGDLGEFGGGAGFEAQIHLARERARHRVDEGGRLHPLHFGVAVLLRGIGDALHGAQLELHRPLDVGPQDLHRTRARSASRSGEPARPKRPRSESPRSGNSRSVIGAEFGAQRLHRLRLGEGRYLVLQARKIVRRLDADHVGARRHELAELDPGRPELFERAGKALARTSPCRRRRAGCAGRRRRTFAATRHARAIGVGDDDVVAHHDSAGAGEAQIVGERCRTSPTPPIRCGGAAMPPE